MHDSLPYTLTSPWLLARPGERSYIEMDREYLERAVTGLLGEEDGWR